MKKFALTVLFVAISLAAFAKTSPYDLTYGPWVTETTDSTFTVLWATASRGIGYVEVVEGDVKGTWYKAEPRRIYQRLDGRYYPATVHQVTVNKLKSGTSYSYKVGGQILCDEIDPYEYTYGFERSTSKTFKVTTFDSSKTTCRFAVVNDMHLNVDKFSALTHVDNILDNDFILLNGDITTVGDYPMDSLLFYNIKPLDRVSPNIPLVFARGNHEGRGNIYEQLHSIYPTSNGKFYYTFRQGPVSFIVLDAGETGAEPAKGFSGGPAYFEYLQEQLDWAKEAVSEPSFKNAPVKVCIIHVPMYPKPNAKAYNCQNWLEENFIPLLNDAGIDLMLSAHVHVYSVLEPGGCGNDFPIVTNSCDERLEFDADSKGIRLRTFDMEGKQQHALDLSL